jgi:hypothetical protein
MVIDCNFKTSGTFSNSVDLELLIQHILIPINTRGKNNHVSVIPGEQTVLFIIFFLILFL